jgi:hypothetical protein
VIPPRGNTAELRPDRRADDPDIVQKPGDRHVGHGVGQDDEIDRGSATAFDQWTDMGQHMIEPQMVSKFPDAHNISNI